MLCKNRASPPSSAAASPPSPAETVLNNDDLLTQILTRLPARSILKFKSVSKRWLALIAAPNFIPRRHLKAISALCFCLARPGPKTSYGFINLTKTLSSSSSSSRAPFTTLDFADNPSDARILNSCNGLVLCCSRNASAGKNSFYVYNPTTNRSTTLPDLTPKPPMICGASLAFDPSKSPHYKVICVIYIGPVSDSDDQHHFKLVLYSSETRAWNPCGDPFSARELEFANGVFWDRSVHWPSIFGETSLRFDVKQEQLRDLLMPPLLITEPELVPVADEDNDDDDDAAAAADENVYARVKSRERSFGRSGDYLHLVEIHESKPLQLEVFELEPDYSGWFVKYKVDLSPVVEAFPEMVGDYDGKPNYTFTLLGLVREEEDDDDESYLVLMLPSSHTVVRYKLKDGSLSKICDLNPDECTVSFGIHLAANLVTRSVYPLITSLASV